MLMFSTEFIPLTVHVQLKVPISDEPNRTVSFIKLLLSRCQQEFQKDNEDDDVVIRTKQKKLDSAARVSVTPDLYRNVF